MGNLISGIGNKVSGMGNDVSLAGNNLSIQSDVAGHVGIIAGYVSNQKRYQGDEGKLGFSVAKPVFFDVPLSSEDGRHIGNAAGHGADVVGSMSGDAGMMSRVVGHIGSVTG